ncbi:kinase family protein-like protein [Halenospora varia]|nr:kinase family protein-like protein [Halenospora varia]
MEFFKSPVASATSKGPPFPYTFGHRVDVDTSNWTLYNGTRRGDGSNCSIFSFDVTANKSRLPMAKNAVRKLRAMRHPGVVKVLDTVEQTIKFINDEASSVHGALRVGSIYTSESGEWKVGGFEVLSSMKEDDAIIYNYGSLRNPLHAVDAYNFGTLIFEVFNGDFMGGDQAGQTKGIPPSMHSSYRRLVNSSPKARVSVANFLEQGRRNGGFFGTPLIKLTESVNSLGMKCEEEGEEFLNDLDQLSDDFPEDYFKIKILPELLKSVDVFMKVSKKLTDDEFESKVTPAVVRLFNSPDRAIRVSLLDNLPVTGFTDVAPVVREQRVKATVNGELLKYLAKTSNDEQPGIRTNTTICLGKIAKNLGVGNRSKFRVVDLVDWTPARSLCDPFIHARNAALMALAATSDSFSEDDVANKILPSIYPCLIDKEKLIRDQANKTMDLFFQRIRNNASSMADTRSRFIDRLGHLLVHQQSFHSCWRDPMHIPPPPTNPRSNSAPVSNEAKRPTPITASASTLHRQAVASPPATSARTSVSSNVNDYFRDQADEDADDTSGNIEAPKPSSKPAPSAANPFEGNGEPDFAGWLAAQAGKKPGAEALPKGLAKPTNGRPTHASRVQSTGNVGAAAAKKVPAKPVVAKKIDTAPKNDDGDDGWGDGW